MDRLHDATTPGPLRSTARPLTRALGGESVAPPPIWLMRQAGRYLPEYRALRAQRGSFLEFCLDPALAAEVTLQPIRRFGLDGAIVFSDILVIPHALGQRVSFLEGEGPRLEAVRTAADIGHLRERAPEDRLSPVWETVARVRAMLPDGIALIGFAGAPWTVACYMVEGGGSRDFAAAKAMALGDSPAFDHLVELLVGATVAHLSGQIAAGAEAVQLFDSWAGVLDESGFERWVIAPTRRITEEIHRRHPGIPLIGFPRGAGLMLERFAAETGVDAVGLDTTVPLTAARTLQRGLPVQGNLDPVALVAGGEALRQGTRRILEALAGGPFVFNLGHGVLPQTPVEHVAALVALVRGWGA